ncbi:MAG: hypothetical protein H6Q59_2776, partial [Firmicutes bacterium]|nr:hypothetical protein [Bacillota bacterium]
FLTYVNIKDCIYETIAKNRNITYHYGEER